MQNGRTRIPDSYPVTDVPAPAELSPQQKAARAERRRELWETAWSVAMLAAVVVIAAASVNAAYWIRETAEVLALKLR